MLSISGNRNRDRWGRTLPDYLRELYKSFGSTLDGFNDERGYRLPVPARYLIDRQGIIRAVDVNADYPIRTEPADALNQLRTLSAAAADWQDQSTWKGNCNPTRCANVEKSCRRRNKSDQSAPKRGRRTWGPTGFTPSYYGSTAFFSQRGFARQFSRWSELTGFCIQTASSVSKKTSLCNSHFPKAIHGIKPEVMNGKGELRVRTYREDERAVVEVGNNAPRISPEIMSDILEPFFATKGVSAGTGLGANTAQQIPRQYRGDVQVHPESGDTRFQVYLPLQSTGDNWTRRRCLRLKLSLNREN
jgi:Histidine kinase-, DNA gyrase B-, and HSP90-like ATPase